MQEIKTILNECSVSDIYCAAEDGVPVVYQIPIYQRNYAWEMDEIYTLLEDVRDSMHKKDTYYIGTLVTYKSGENVFEVIDGQQRLTTIYIILKVLGVTNIVNRLTYSARKVSDDTIKRLPEFGEEYDRGIKNGYKYAEEALKEIAAGCREEFKDYFLNKVHIIHYRVPKDVDLNHYFEVMNSRGEQLEKHEIIKARLSEKLSDKLDADSMLKFNQIWEACSDMSFYLQQKLPSAMSVVFGAQMDSFTATSFDNIPNATSDANTSSGQKTIAELIEGTVKNLKEDKKTDKNDRFQPIIDFPNFLLIVLKLTRLQDPDFVPTDFILDDKELIKMFDTVESEGKLDAEFVKTFAYNLLKAKYYLDNYVIHHTNSVDRAGENPWKLQTYYKEGNKYYAKDLISPKDSDGNEDKSSQAELVHLLSMFEVAFTPKQRKNYLFYCLVHLFEDNNTEKYLYFVRRLADKYFYDIYLDSSKLNDNNNQPKPNSFDSTIFDNRKLNINLSKNHREFNNVFKPGSSSIPLYVFNYTDYRIWKMYAEKVRGKRLKKESAERIDFFNDLGCADFELDFFDTFYFSRTRKSLEHYYPQAKAKEDGKITPNDINCFGNFAMISSDANSSGANWNPTTKLDHYLDTKFSKVSTASLKFRIMMEICKSNRNIKPLGYEWDKEDMENHQKKMIDIIIYPKLPSL